MEKSRPLPRQWREAERLVPIQFSVRNARLLLEVEARVTPG